MLSVGLSAQLACVWEATACKPGNVHRNRDFDELSYLDFLVSAAAIAPVLESARRRRVGRTILEAVQATRQVIRTNTNLGIILLLSPLAAAPEDTDLSDGVAQVLTELDVHDAQAAYEAIRLAVPGGLGKAPEQDVHEEPTQTLREVMELAASRDLIARQYANSFHEVFADGVPALRQGLERTGALEDAIIHCHLHLMANYPDSLIARKCGLATAQEAGRRARAVLDAEWPHSTAGRAALADLDSWLRGNGHLRNPGTTADLVTACLFVLLRMDNINVQSQYPWHSSPHHD